MKLEGAEKAGYQSIVIGSVRDPFIIRQIDDWTERLTARIHARVKTGLWRAPAIRSVRAQHSHLRQKRHDGTLEPVKEIRSHELCLLIEVTAPSAGHRQLDCRHHSPSGTPSADSRMERPHHSTRMSVNPAHLDRGPVYRFNVNHVVEPDDPYEMFRMEFLEVNGSQFARAAA